MVERLLIVQTAFLGDVVLSTPLIQALRKELPAAYLAALVRPAAAPLLEGLPGLDEVLTDRPGDRGAAPQADLVQELRRRRFDAAVSPSRSVRVGLLLRAARIARRIGYRLAFNRWFYTDLVERQEGVHTVVRESALLGPLGIHDIEPRLAVARAERLPALIEALFRAPARHRVVLAPGTNWATKRWPAEYFAAVANAMAARQAQVLLVGSPAEAAAVLEVARRAPAAVNLSGQTTLPQLAALMARCDAVVCNDSGPAHIAGAAGTPVVQIYGATTPGMGYAPLDPRSRIVETFLPCRPCGRHATNTCPESHFRCLRDLTPDRVLAALEEVLAGGLVVV
jgi:lipopolysaccharide heptosyltransferase II